VLMAFVPPSRGQGLLFDGYLTHLQAAIGGAPGSGLLTDNLIHNRLNLNWYGEGAFSASLQVRTRLLWGERVRLTPGIGPQMDGDNGWADLTTNLARQDAYLLNTTADRLWLGYTQGPFEATLGRQRGNWGVSYVWNPNDIFNVYSFFDFDYVERPGSDALRLRYNTGMASSVELAAKLDSAGRLTSGLLTRLNRWNYDFQLLLGLLDERDWVLGGGWAGGIGGYGFKGELSYFHPREGLADTTGLFLGSISLDYNFSSGLFAQVEALVASSTGGVEGQAFSAFYSGPLSVKSLAFAPLSLFGQVSYPISPILNASFSGIYYPKLKGYFVGPSLSVSVAQTVDFSLFAQFFKAQAMGSTQRLNMAFARLKWSF